MARIDVKVRSDNGDLGTHPKYGRLVPGTTINIDEADFGEQLFERPSPDWLSPHEKRDAERAAELNQPVGGQTPPPAKGSKKEVK